MAVAKMYIDIQGTPGYNTVSHPIHYSSRGIHIDNIFRGLPTHARGIVYQHLRNNSLGCMYLGM